MFDKNSLVDIYLSSDGTEVVTVSEADSHFPRSLTLYADIAEAYIVAEDELGCRPEDYEVESSKYGNIYIHAPYNICISKGKSMVLENPPRFLCIRLREGEKHYFPFGDNNERDDYSEEVALLFEDKNTEIKILREAAEVMKEIEGLDDDFFYNDIDTEEIYKKFPNFEVSDFLKKNDEDRDEDGIEKFIEAMKRVAEENGKCYIDRMDAFCNLMDNN